jgi:hypothetical protein
MELNDAVEKVLKEKINKDYVFDSHAVIAYLLKNDSDAYLKFCKAETTESSHSQIAKIISGFEGSGMIEKVSDKSWSKNIHDQFTPCACWKKLK